MSPATVVADVVLILSAATLFYVALTDLREFKIRNELVLVLAGLYILHAVLSGRWVDIHWNIGFALLMLGFMVYFYSQGLMGGGDVKMLAVAFLWVGLRCAFVFAVLLTVFILIHLVVVRFGWAKVQEIRGVKRIPFAPSIAAALIVTFMSGCLQPGPLPWPLSSWHHPAEKSPPNPIIQDLQKQLNRPE